MVEATEEAGQAVAAAWVKAAAEVGVAAAVAGWAVEWVVADLVAVATWVAANAVDRVRANAAIHLKKLHSARNLCWSGNKTA